ncbi:unnamed protein product [Rotaria sp. Silwood1]|nr:unnamed protein product [Rotaria sp. Silwood1]CAF1136682.1 unnamed protein product [Rotaria sp. Silwood1]CAF1140717.1 unnamed protein product [Rotaria sp. Silwood1]
MKNIKSVIYLLIFVRLSVAYCNEHEQEEFNRSLNKRSCVALGDICNTGTDCCGWDALNWGHCVMCSRGLFGIHRRCGCDVTGSVTVDSNNRVSSDRCDGRKSKSDRCRTRVAPPGHRYYRGKSVV